METIKDLLTHHPFFKAMPMSVLDRVAGCGKNIQWKGGELAFREGDNADQFYVVREGVVSLEIVSPKRGAIVIQTIHAGEVLGWSWLFPPYRWHFDARVIEPVRATALDGACLRDKCEKDPAFGYFLMKSFAGLLIDRLQATRLQLLDAYETKDDDG